MSIASAARRVARLVRENNCKVVFAESCTGGLVSGALTKIAGISAYHCGGVIVYRNETKMAYLDIPADVLADPGPVSPEVAELMVRRVLRLTPEAEVAASVTGHLGPNAPRQLDGRVYVAVGWRDSRVKLHPLRCRRGDSRGVRQRWVVERMLDLLADELEGPGDK
jgi:PncC family amidohydrolase